MKNVRRKVTATTLCIIMVGLFLVVGCKKDDGGKGNNSNLATIVNDNSSWAVLTFSWYAGDTLWCVYTEYVYFAGDSIVAEKSYKKVFSCDDKLHENIKYEGLIREQNKKTYFIPVNSETEYLLYDFSLEEGMSFEYNGGPISKTLYVSSVDFVEVNGSIKKRIQIKEHPSAEYEIDDTWIEEIGSLYGILYPCIRLFSGGAGKELLCHYQNGELIYKNPAYFECYYDPGVNLSNLSVQTIVIDDCSIYPNPVDNILTVFSSNNTIKRIEIFDTLPESNPPFNDVKLNVRIIKP